MYVYEEIINGKKLTEIINETHENVKYLPGHKLPNNVVGTSYLNMCLTQCMQYNVACTRWCIQCNMYNLSTYIYTIIFF